MKTEIESSKEEKKFKPFVIKITVEDIEEARLMFHIYNRLNLRDAIFTEGYETMEAKERTASSITGIHFTKIRNEIERQGFEI